MATQLKKKFIGNDQVDGSKILLEQGQSVRIKDSTGTEVELVKLGASDEVLVKGQEVSLKADLQAEVASINGAFTQVNSEISSLSSSLASSVSALEDALDQEISDRDSADAAVLASSQSYTDAEILAEETARIDADVNLQTQISSNFSSLTADIAVIESSLNQEILNRQSEDANLQSQIDAISGGGSGSLSAIQAELDATQASIGLEPNGDYFPPNVIHGGNATTVKQSILFLDDIISEIESKTGVNTGYGSTEWGNSPSAELLASITLKEGIISVDGRVSQEISDRQSAVSGLQSQIDNVLSNVDGAALDSLTEIVSAFQAADASLNGAITALSTGLSADIAAESAARISSDLALQGEIDAEEAARLAGDQTLQNNINGKVSKTGGDSLSGTYTLSGNIQAGDANFGGTGFSVVNPAGAIVEMTENGVSAISPDSSNISSMAAGSFEVTKLVSGTTKQFLIENGFAKLQTSSGVAVMPVADQDLAVKKYVDQADSALDARLDVLEAVVWVKEKFSIVNGQTTVTLSFTPKSGSVSAFVDRLAIHEGAGEDYAISGTTMTFLNDLVSPGQSQLGNGDTVYVKYQK